MSTVLRALDKERKKPMNMAWVSRSPELGANYERHFCRSFCAWDAEGRP